MNPLITGTRFLIDTSAIGRARHPGVWDTIAGLIDNGMACTCLTIDLEMGYSARNPAELQLVQRTRRDLFASLPITDAIAERAQQVQALLAERGLHRAAGPLDLITAAVAEANRAVVLHYDADFEHIASVTRQRQEWIAPRGSLP